MGYDKLLSFFTKNLSNNIIEDLYKPTIVANHIYFDMNFLVYSSIFNIENEINSIYKIIFGISYTNIEILECKLKNIFNLFHWNKVLDSIDMIKILDGSDIDDIIKNFNNIINISINDLLYWSIYKNICDNITKTHPLEFIQSINIFLDGIPAYSKIIEQRRRRMKNYIDSKNRKKIFNKYFENIINNLITEDEICYDYFEWIKNLYSFTHNLGPHSNIMILLGKFILNNLILTYPNIKITLDGSNNNGESDYKIFSHIKKNNINLDIAIHSCDSDFIFMCIWYQLISNISGIDINIMLINYNTSNITTMISSKKIIQSLLDKYNTITQIITTDININIIFDLLFIILMFGNDIIPPNYQLGPELNLKLLFETHYSLYLNNEFVINLNNINIINFNNLIKWLTEINNKKSFDIIILNRFYKLPYSLIINMTDKYNINEIIDKVLIPYNKQKLLNPHIKIIDSFNLDEYIDIVNVKAYGLIPYERNYEITNNSYQSLYNYIIKTASDITENEFNRPYKIFFSDLIDASTDYIDITSKCNIKQYLELLIYNTQILFYDFNLYSPYSLFYYSDMIAPSIEMLIGFINLNCMRTLQEECYNNIINSKNNSKYFNSISHHLFITPYLLDTNYSDSIKEIEHINSLLNVISNNIPGIWYKENENFILKNIEPNEFIILCNNMISMYQNNFIFNIFKKFNNLLNF